MARALKQLSKWGASLVYQNVLAMGLAQTQDTWQMLLQTPHSHSYLGTAEQVAC